ncbi:MAG: histidinol-phosphate transaminase [Andreesenia angusta]|nr:histidinol-phosphate transaminase [Andreesenia angusta]
MSKCICKENILKVTPYQPGRPIADVKKDYGLDNVVKLASNENPLGCSPRVIDKIKNSLDELAIYPDGACLALKDEISKKFNISKDMIAISSGSDEIIDLISKVFIDKDDEVIMASVTFVRYNDTANLFGGKPVIVPLEEWRYNLDGIYNSITENTKVIWLCNPNNPTGTIFSEEEVINFLKKVPEDILVVYDEAYAEYAESKKYPKNSHKLVEKYNNLMVLKTFSKAYGLAAFRIGYSFAHPNIISYINRARGPFNVNSLAQIAAIEALNDDDFLKKVYENNIEGKYYLYEEFDKLGIEYTKSEANHIFFKLDRNAQEVFIELQKKGVIIRPILENHLRVSIGTMDENKFFIEKLKEVLKD